MSPLQEIPVDLHLMDAPRSGKLRVTDPLKSFLRVAEKRLKWKLHWHADDAEMATNLRSAEYPPYFYCVKDKHLLPLDVLHAVAEQGGYLYEDLPSDALSLFRMLTTTQAWTVACTDAQVGEATAALGSAWTSIGLRTERHPEPELVQPTRQDADIGGGFKGGFDPDDDKDWAELSSDESSDSDSDEAELAKDTDSKATEPAADAKPASSTTSPDSDAKKPETKS
jgi:hypothetical protein